MSCRRLYIGKAFLARAFFPVGRIYRHYVEVFTWYALRVFKVAKHRLYSVRKVIFGNAFIKKLYRFRHYLNAVYLFRGLFGYVSAHYQRNYTAPCTQVAHLMVRCRVGKIRKEKCVRAETVILGNIYLCAGKVEALIFFCHISLPVYFPRGESCSCPSCDFFLL